MAVVSGGGGGGGGSGTGWTTAAVTLTNAQVLALPSTPIQLIAAPGAGKALVSPASGHGFGFIVCDTTAAAYTNVNDDTHCLIRLSLGENSVVSQFAYGNSLLTFGAIAGMALNPAGVLRSPGTTSAPLIQSPVDDVANVENQALMLDLANVLGDLTGGNAANSLKITVGYLTVTL